LVRELASGVGVASACAGLGVSRDSFYRWRRTLETHGEAGLRPKLRSFPSRQVAPDVEVAVLVLAAWYPKWGKRSVATVLTNQHIEISPSGVRSVWLRRNLGTKHGRSAYSKSMGPSLRRLTRFERELFYGLPIDGLRPRRRQAPERATEDHPRAPVKIMDAQGKVLRVFAARPKEKWVMIKCRACRKLFYAPPYKCPRCGAERGPTVKKPPRS